MTKSPASTTIRTALVITLSLCLITACQTNQEKDTAANNNVPSSTTVANTNPGQCSTSALTIKNPEFTFDYQRGRPAGWLINQHAGDKTYEVLTKQGVLRINNYGKQYWMRLSQRYPAHELVGKSFKFSADIKMDLNPEGWIKSLTAGGGLTVVVRGQKPGTHNPKAVLYTASMPNEPRHGKVDWRRLSHEFTIPEGARFLELGFLHQAHGEMWMKNPEVVELGC